MWVILSLSPKQISSLDSCNIKQRGDKKEPLLIHTELVANPNNKQIYKVNKLLNSIIKVELPHPKREVIQCHRFQQFGHTHKYCKRSPRCVECIGNHLSSACPKNQTRNKEIKCTNCQENHPANSIMAARCVKNYKSDTSQNWERKQQYTHQLTL